MKRVLIINPNTSTVTNARIRHVADSLISHPDQVEIVSASSGVPLIETIEQSYETVPAVLDTVQSRHHEFSAIIIAAFSDPGLFEARKISPRPVLGISESAMKIASRGAGKFAIVTLGETLTEAILYNAEAYGYADQLSSVRVLPWSVTKVSADPRAYHHAFAETCEALVKEEDVGAVIVGGGPLSGIAEAIAQRVTVPVLDGVHCAILLAIEAAHAQTDS